MRALILLLSFTLYAMEQPRPEFPAQPARSVPSRPGTPFNNSPHRTHRSLQVPPVNLNGQHIIDMPMSPVPSPYSPEEIHVVEVQAHAQEVKAISKKKIACFVAASAITSAVLTAAVTLTIHFTDCKK